MKEKLIGGALGLVVAFAVLGVYVKDRDGWCVFGLLWVLFVYD